MIANILFPNKSNKLETDIGFEYPIHSEFTAWEYNQLPQVLDDIKKTGKTPLITWEAWEPNGEVEQPKYSLKSILAGEHDDFIRKNAQVARDFGEAMFMRLFHEGNGNWYPWAVGVNGNTAEDYVEAWAYIRKIFKEEKADNVTFVWSPNAEDVGTAKMEQIKPREEDYDWAAIDGYNWGTTQKKATAGYDSQWQEFVEIMQGPYQRLLKITKKPFMVAETGTVAEGGDKSEWIKQMFAVLPREFMNIFTVVYFNIDKEQGGAAVQLRIDEKAEVLAAFKKAIENPIFDRKKVKIADNKIIPVRAVA